MEFGKFFAVIFLALVIGKFGLSYNIHEKYLYLTLALFIVSLTFSKKEKVELFEGSGVAFDKDAFENLNRVVNEIAGEGKLTIPGNLIVQGKTILKGETDMENNVKLKNNKGMFVEGKGFVRFGNGKGEGKNANDDDGIISANKYSPGLNIVGVRNGDSTKRDVKIWGPVISQGGEKFTIGDLAAKSVDMSGKFICRGPSQFESQKNKGTWTHINWTDGKSYFRDFVRFDNEVQMHRSKHNVTMNDSSNISYINQLRSNGRDVIKTGDSINIASNGKNTSEKGSRLLYDYDTHSKNSQYARFDQEKDMSGNEGYELKIRKHKPKSNTSTNWNSFY